MCFAHKYIIVGFTAIGNKSEFMFMPKRVPGELSGALSGLRVRM
ncbi:hypothetical protein CLOBOL_06206 [Enterocloster bolteae ATCC BAA-613]|uniref:Uncharacterized protein n=1 Tax=Enterocloster bolteae (strain ATCC BAA-613 / DSM 15670 / CCUG 46953 / JCM 12243 / WAL 16351) TaxID=411902 RepID=A8S1Y0_ENTBW|nr:hypothetical protein CLOBOL_06206 [Enterocloster bolteae ATCC BAA-613]